MLLEADLTLNLLAAGGGPVVMDNLSRGGMFSGLMSRCTTATVASLGVRQFDANAEMLQNAEALGQKIRTAVGA